MWTLTQVLLANALLIVSPGGTGQCPQVSQVKEQLNQLIPGLAAEDSSSEQVILIETEDGGVALEMRSIAYGTVLRRRLPPRESCTEQAILVATIIASWQTEAQTEAQPLPIAAKPLSIAAKPLPRARPPLRYELSLGLVTSLSSSGFALGGGFDASLMPWRRPVQLRLGLLGLGLREVALGPGGGRYTRFAARTGVGYRVLAREWTLDLAADFLWALGYMTGRDFDTNLTALGFDAGLAPSLRLGRQLGPLRLFLDFACIGWLRKTELTTQLGGLPAAVDRAELPRIEGLFGLGLTYFSVAQAHRAEIP